MGNIASSNVATPWGYATWGNKRIVHVVVTGDGSNAVLPVPIRPVHVFIALDQGSNSDTALVTNGVYFTMDNSSQPYTVTYSAAPTNNKKHTVFIVGDD